MSWRDQVATMRMPSEYTSSDECLQLIKNFEGLRLNAYQDSVGVWTIGVGSTRGVYKGMSITEEEAMDLLRNDLLEAERGVVAVIKAPITQYQFDALASFTFNLGVGNLGSSTLARLLNAKEYSSVPAQILRWNKAGGKVLTGLVRRRIAEKLLFEGRDWKDYESEYQRGNY